MCSPSRRVVQLSACPKKIAYCRSHRHLAGHGEEMNAADARSDDLTHDG
jgi:hypothetical protein